ncbi:hypothetical protein AVEN_229274-1 [Araneus ventricosus]|uniref:Uncharacterized protein n=1 Tax=Araneus ventricosus TaxID=182803 RepID=A0A4Y1ZQJ9_ARAVE|nr:hypothetical protein AVEN_229274-1 [Araneus ventricosus]
MKKRREERMFVVGEIVRHPNKSWRPFGHASEGMVKRVLSWNLEDDGFEDPGLEKSNLRRGTKKISENTTPFSPATASPEIKKTSRKPMVEIVKKRVN